MPKIDRQRQVFMDFIEAPGLPVREEICLKVDDQVCYFNAVREIGDKAVELITECSPVALFCEVSVSEKWERLTKGNRT